MINRRRRLIGNVMGQGTLMRTVLLTWVLVTSLIAASGCGNETARNAPTEDGIRFGHPSVGHIVEHVQPEALAAFSHAKRFILDGKVDTSELDLMKPEVFHWCPPQSVYHDWLVSFPRKHGTSWEDKALLVAVLNDGTCWVWQVPNPSEPVP